MKWYEYESAVEVQDTLLPAFQEHRSLLFGIAYRMLGSVADADDMVQETYLRWQRQNPEVIECPRAWLTATITRLCIDHLKSARVRREEYVGVWLPEPLVGQADSSPRGMADSLSTAFLVLLETLTPAERAVFLLREVFQYDYAEIGRILDKDEANCRQMLRRAREHVAVGRSRFDPNPARGEELLRQFMNACRQGDTDGLLGLLHEDVVLYSDGGGKVSAAPAPVVGLAKVSRFLIGVSRIGRDTMEVKFSTVNAAPGALVYREGRLSQTTSLHIVDGKIAAIYVVRNPEKLGHLA